MARVPTTERIEGIAVESNGNLIVRTGGGNGIAVDSFGNVLQGPIAIDLATNDRYVDTGELIHVLRANEELFEVFGFGDLRSAEGPVFDQSTRALYVANTGENDIAVFNPAATPEVKTGSATNLTVDSATITGYVDPSSAGSVSSCYFEYGTDTTYALGKLPCSPEAPLSVPTEVTAALTGLTPFTSYHYRLVTVSSDGTNYPTYGRDRTVTAIPGLTPTVGSTESSNITPTTASLTADLDPNFAPTIYRFEYGTDASYGSETLPSESIGADGAYHSVSSEIIELQPATTYHFRVVALNFNGVTDGPDQIFTTSDVPTIDESAVSGVTSASATVSALIHPGFRATTYHVEYGSTATYGSSTAESMPVGSDNASHLVSTTIYGLSPEATYHYRVVATNSIGATDGPDQTFTTAAAPAITPRPVTCKSGFVRKHGKCVKKPHHHGGHQNRKHHRGSN